MRILAWVAAALVVPTSLTAQSVAVAPHLGSLGLGVDVGASLTDIVSVRGGLNFQPYSPELDLSDVTYKLDLPSPTVTAMVDIHPGGRSFRFSGGFLYFAGDLALSGLLNEATEIGSNVYTPAEVGTLTGILVTNAFAPYLGIGVGNVAHGTTGFFLDAGVAFHGTPGVELLADGPISTDTQFQADLNQEATELLDDVEGITVYPILSIGVRIAVRQN